MYKIIIAIIVIMLLIGFLPTKLHYLEVEAYNPPVEVVKPPIKEYAEQMVLDTFGAYWNEFNELINRESKWDSQAQNPNSTAFGLAQFLNSTWKSVDCIKTPDPYKQIDCAIVYIKDRYDNPAKALKFHRAKGWY